MYTLRLQLNFRSESESMSSILIVSESKRIELYAKNEEYLSTFGGRMLEESDSDMKVYSVCVEIPFPPLSECSLKLTGVSRSCWILSVVISYSSQRSLDNKSFDVERVNSLLDNARLSDKAAEFKKLFETFQATKPQPPPSLAAAASSSTMIPRANFGDFGGIPALLKTELSAMEKRLNQRMDKEFQKQNEKLDRIIEMLQSKNEYE